MKVHGIRVYSDEQLFRQRRNCLLSGATATAAAIDRELARRIVPDGIAA